MATFSNGQYFLWSQRTAPASPYTKAPPTGARTIADFAPHVMSQPIFGTGGGLQALIIRPTWQVPLLGAAADRFFPFTALKRGATTLLGHTYQDGDPVSRRVLIFTEPPPIQYVGEAISNADGLGSYSIPNLPAGTYLLIDYDPTVGGEGPLGHAWVVVP